jgi:phenylacetate-CoA ligase
MKENIHARLVYPAIIRAIGEHGMYAELERLTGVQYASREEILESQHRKLAGILHYARRHVPRYRGILGESWGLGTSDPTVLLRRIPFLTKESLQTSLEDLKAIPQPPRTSRKTTGGSTGQPVTVIKDSSASARERAATWMAYGWFGVRPGDRGARFWGSPRALGRRRLRFALADLAMNRVRFSAFGVSDAELEEYWSRCLRFRPQYFYGYVSMLEAFGRFVEESGRDGTRLGLKTIITTSEILTEAQRYLLHRVFGAPVQNEYGCGEVGPIAYQCEDGGMHVMSENVFVEVLDEDDNPVRPGEEGEVVVTDLSNRAMPILRYRIRDRATLLDTCTCGRGFPVLGEVRGRIYDQVKGPDGRFYHGEFFMYLFEDLRDSGSKFDRFRVVQLTPLRLLVEVQVAKTDSDDLAGVVRRRVESQLPGMDVRVRIVEELDLPPSGKLRIIENRVSSHAD